MKTRQTRQQTAVALDLFWCSDCRAGELFERVGDSSTGADWVCTSCGAGYFDALDRVLSTDGVDSTPSVVA
jgi:hypothetical protein